MNEENSPSLSEQLRDLRSRPLATEIREDLIPLLEKAKKTERPPRKPKYFDFLTDQGRDPDFNQRYWYVIDMAWDESKPFMEQQCQVRKFRVVHKLTHDSGYEFEFVDEPGKVYHCNYTWAFVAITPVNRVIYPIYRALNFISKRIAAIVENWRQSFDTLKLEKPKGAPSES